MVAGGWRRGESVPVVTVVVVGVPEEEGGGGGGGRGEDRVSGYGRLRLAEIAAVEREGRSGSEDTRPTGGWWRGGG